ncbi:peptidase inhibitor family I36 protein (plasmid) [Streptomyces sp. NBC_01450]|nr:peptidase inhibitor family I36 protein [Streptomyces sp. NBC_01450]
MPRRSPLRSPSVGLLASPADAAYLCGSSEVCLYQNTDFTGSV